VSRFGIIPASIFDADLTPQDIALLALLSTYADKAGYCYPSYETIADKLNRSKAWVSQRMSALEAEGFLKISMRRGQKYGFTILYDNVQPTEQSVQPAEHTVQPAEQNSTKNNKYRYRIAQGIPENFTPTAEMLLYLAEARPDIDPKKFTRDFITRCQAKGYTYKWWDKAWENWVNSEASPHGKKPKATINLHQIHDAFADASKLADKIAGRNGSK
jgi:biotin operon repressor